MEEEASGLMTAAEKEVADELVAEALRLQDVLNTPPRLEDTMESFFSMSAPVRVPPGELLGSAESAPNSGPQPPPGGRQQGPGSGPRPGGERRPVNPQPAAHLCSTEELESRLAHLREEVKSLESQNAALKEQAGWRVSGKPKGKGETRPEPREALKSELRILREEKERLLEDVQRVEKKLAETEAKFRQQLPTRSGFQQGRGAKVPEGGAQQDLQADQIASGQKTGEAPPSASGEEGGRPKSNKVDEYRELIEQLQWERHLMSQEHQKMCRKIAKRVNGYFHMERKLGAGLQKLSFLVLRQQAEIRHLLAVLPPQEREQIQRAMERGGLARGQPQALQEEDGPPPLPDL